LIDALIEESGMDAGLIFVVREDDINKHYGMDVDLAFVVREDDTNNAPAWMRSPEALG
jgi:antibiotic biosynthesis monooxygenase (ABM) superfamily enzyme